MAQNSQETPKRPMWKRYFLWGMPIAGVAGAFVAGIIFWGGFNTAMEATNTMSFCISCHEMENNVYQEYKGTIHDKNRTGVGASCSDCHVPDPWIHKMVRKVKASRELFSKAMGTIDTREKFEDNRLRLATRVWESMKATDSRECRNCHTLESMSPQFQVPRARKQHLTAMETGQTCIDCHKGIAHSDSRRLLSDEDLERLETPNPAHIREVPDLFLESLAYIERIEAEEAAKAAADEKAAAAAVDARVAAAVEAAIAEEQAKAVQAASGQEAGATSVSEGNSVATNIDWDAVPASNLTLFYPGQATFEWAQNGKFHNGARPLTKGGEPCASCHANELETIGNKIVQGGELEPTPIPGKRGTIRVTAQAAHDDDNLYVRLQWPDAGHNPAPFAEGGKMDPDNQIKVAMMITGTGIEMGEITGCWASCHSDNTNMPFAPEAEAIAASGDVATRLMATDTIQKYLTESRTEVEVKGRRGKPLGGWDKLTDEAETAQLLADGTFLDLMRVYADGSASNGYLLDRRVENEGEITAQAALNGSTWTVVFARPLNSGAPGDVAIEPGKTYTFGIAIHDDFAANRFHHVSLESKLALDDDTATLNVVKQ